MLATMRQPVHSTARLATSACHPVNVLERTYIDYAGSCGRMSRFSVDRRADNIVP